MSQSNLAVVALLAITMTFVRGPEAGVTPAPGLAPQGAGRVSTQWIDRTPQGKKVKTPPAGEDCAVIYDPTDRRILLFGGKNDMDRLVNEVWSFALAKLAWEPIKSAGQRSPPTEDHTSIYDPIGQRMIIYGGDMGATTNNLWSFDVKTLQWRNLTGPSVPKRESHAAVYDERGKRMIVFGGLDGGNIDLYEILALDLDPASPTFEKWQNLTVQEGHPPGRIDHTMVYDAKKNRLVVNAGYTKGRKEVYSDTWEFTFGATPATPGRWRQIETGKTFPAARRHAVGVHDTKRSWFIMYGGQGKNGLVNDAWAFDLESEVWMNITPSVPGPKPRIDHQAIYDPESTSMFVYGGDPAILKEQFKHHDMWELHIQSPPPTAPVRPERSESK